MVVDPTSWPVVVLPKASYYVCPTYVGPISIGDAEKAAKFHDCELPTPALVDAIWAAADCKLDARKFVIQHDGTARTMASPLVLEAQRKKAELQLGAWVLDHGQFQLSAGYFKDVVVTTSGKIGLYGWQLPTGRNIQPLFTGHSKSWIDYSQGLRLVQRVK